MKFEYADAIVFIGSSDEIRFGVITEIATIIGEKGESTKLTVIDLAGRAFTVTETVAEEVRSTSVYYSQTDTLIYRCPAANWARDESERRKNPAEIVQPEALPVAVTVPDLKHGESDF